MGVGSYLRLKGRSSVFRRKVPQCLRARLARTEICATLGVVGKESAERGARQVAVAVDNFFLRAVRDMSLTASDLSLVVAKAIETWREDHERDESETVLARGRMPATPRDTAKILAETAEMVFRAHAGGVSLHGNDYVADSFAAAELEPPVDPVDLHRAGRGLTLGLSTFYLGAAVELADRHDLGRGILGLPVERWRARHQKLVRQLGLDEAPVRVRQPVTRDAIGGPGRPEPALATAEPNRQLTTVAPDEPVFSTVIAESLERRIKTGELAKSALQDAQATIRIWIEVVGDRPLKTYRREDMSRFQEILVQLPKHYWRSEAARKKPILDVIAEAASVDANYVRVQNTTVNKHLCIIAPFFDWAVKHGKMLEPAQNFWTGFLLPTGSKVTGLEINEERPGWPDDQIAKLFEHPVYTGRRSEYFYNEPGSVIIRDGLYWTPVVAGLHGMRREEFSQLRVRHVKQIEGIWVFDLHGSDINLKTSWSRRYVPLHRDLFDLGFVEDKVVGRQPDEMLFTEFKRSAANAVYGDGIGKRVARMMERAGMQVIRKDGTESDGVYHPFRHRLRTLLVNKNVNEAVIDSITGHSPKRRGGQQARYTDTVHVPVLKQSIDLVYLPYDIQKLNKKWLDCCR